jgi:putative transposase
MSLRSLDNAFKNLFHKNADHPKFRKKGKNDYFAITQHVKIEKKRIHFLKFKEGIYFKGSKERVKEIKEINKIIITKDAVEYFCSIIYEKDEKSPEKKELSAESSIGIDLEIEKFATLSDGIAVENPRLVVKVKVRIKKLQKQWQKKKNKRDRKIERRRY